jgi:integrase
MSISVVKTRESGERRYRSRICHRGRTFSKTFRTRELALAHERKTERELAAGELYRPERAWRTVRDVYKHWLEFHLPNLAASTRPTAIRHADLFVEAFGSVLVEQIEAARVRTWLRSIADKYSWCKATTTKHRNTIMTILNVAVQDDVISRNPLDGKLHGLTGSESTERIPPTVEEARALLEKLQERAKDSPQEEWVVIASRLAATTGIRRGEIFALERENYDRARKVLLINRSLCAVSNKIGTTKTKDRREFPLPFVVASALESYIEHLPSQTPYLFPSPIRKDRPRNCGQAAKYINDLYRELGFNFTLHCWRHFLVTRLVAGQNLSFDAARKVSGHKSMGAFSRYVHSDIQRNAEVLDVHVRSFLPVAPPKQAS